MRRNITRKGSIPVLVLLAVLATASAGYAGIPTAENSFPSASEPVGDHRPSTWAYGREAASSGKAPSLTNDIGASEGDTSSQLLFGLGLATLGLLVLVAAGAARAGKARGARDRSDAFVASRPGPTRSPVETGARS